LEKLRYFLQKLEKLGCYFGETSIRFSKVGETRAVSRTGETQVSPIGETRVSPIGETRVSPIGETRVSPILETTVK
jgi:hypothetical protein